MLTRINVEESVLLSAFASIGLFFEHFSFKSLLLEEKMISDAKDDPYWFEFPRVEYGVVLARETFFLRVLRAVPVSSPFVLNPFKELRMSKQPDTFLHCLFRSGVVQSVLLEKLLSSLEIR